MCAVDLDAETFFAHRSSSSSLWIAKLFDSDLRYFVECPGLLALGGGGRASRYEQHPRSEEMNVATTQNTRRRHACRHVRRRVRHGLCRIRQAEANRHDH